MSSRQNRWAEASAALICFCAVGFHCKSSAADTLPRPDPPFKGKIAPTVHESTPNWPQHPKATPGDPNIVLILLDDAGFAATSTFGGPVLTTALDGLAARGLRYNRFHVTAQCSPTRASFLTGASEE
jgi:Sulfatase